MTQQIQDIWKRFDNLIANSNGETKLLIEAIKLHAELCNLRLGALPHEVAAIVQRGAQTK